MDATWIKNIHNTIKGFSDLNRQQKAWRGLDDEVVSSYIEDYNLLFYTFDFDYFIDEWNAENLNHKTWVEMSKFKEILYRYDNSISEEMRLDDIRIIEDPNWLKVIYQANLLIKTWSVYI